MLGQRIASPQPWYPDGSRRLQKVLLGSQVRLDIEMVHHDGMVNAATFQKEVQVGLRLLQVPPQLRRLEFARTTPSGTHFAQFVPI